MLDRLVKIFTSLKLTVVLLGLGLVLVFWGTLAQVNLGLYKAQNEFFRSFFIYWHPTASSFKIPVFPGGYSLGGLLLINLFSAHLRYYQPGKRKIGIAMIHLGVVLLLFGQLLTDVLSTESSMHIRQGSSANYSEAGRSFELVVIDTTDADLDKVVAIPEHRLLKRGDISHSELPFAVRVKAFYGNSSLVEKADPNYQEVKTTAGFGADFWWRELPRETVMDRRDMPSGIVELLTAQGSLGTYLVSGFLGRPQQLTHNGRTYQLQLRPVRIYKPFRMHLVEFKFDKYPGTEIPKNFSSRVRLQRPDTGENREVLIYMNNPLRYAGETYYQADWDHEDEKGTILQVVHNPSWLTPYFSCVLVAAGLIVQFLTHLFRFATKRRAPMKNLLKILPWCFLALFATEIVVVMIPKNDQSAELHVREFGRLPVLLNGRIQPFDSVARNTLLQIRSTGDVPLEEVPSWKFWHHPKKLKSTEWLLEVFFKPEVADTRPIFLIHHPDLISELKLAGKGVEKSGLRYYTFKEIEPLAAEIGEQGRKAGTVEDAQRTTYQKQILKLANAVFLYQRLKSSIEPEGTHDFSKLIAGYQTSLAAGVAAFRAQQAGEKADSDALQQLAKNARRFDAMAGFAYGLLIPPTNPEKDRNAWENVGTSLVGSIQTGEIHPAVTFFARMATAYGHNDAAEFNSAVAGYKEWLAPKFSRELAKGRAEFYYNQVKAFLHATIIYIVALLLAGGALLTFGVLPALSESLRRSAFYLIALAFVVHTFGLIFRMALEGRPPVTNLYSSAIFIGWGACVLGLVLERVYKVGLGSAVAGFAGFVTLLIAHNLALGGDTMEMMRAVLDTNFWLATHVVVVTLGYASTFVAGTLAMSFIILGLFTPLLSKRTGDVNLGKALTKMVYAIVCFATLFSFTGTVLGGIWADQSWGRFWGWDPKENGALLIVIWNALILHARWGGLVRERGLMNLAIFGNIVTAFSWFGVNMLGIGLHSYGFMDAAFKWLMLFVGSQVCLIILGVLPLSMWKSFQNRAATPEPPAGSSGGKTTSPAPAGA